MSDSTHSFVSLVNVAKNQPVKESSSEHNVTSSPKVVDGIFISRHPNGKCLIRLLKYLVIVVNRVSCFQI